MNLIENFNRLRRSFNRKNSGPMTLKTHTGIYSVTEMGSVETTDSKVKGTFLGCAFTRTCKSDDPGFVRIPLEALSELQNEIIAAKKATKVVDLTNGGINDLWDAYRKNDISGFKKNL